MAHTPIETAEGLTQFDGECARFLGHEIHPVHFSQRAHIEFALGGITRLCDKPGVLVWLIAPDKRDGTRSILDPLHDQLELQHRNVKDL